MPSIIQSAMILAELQPRIRAKFYKSCPDCGAKPKEWCEGRMGTICSRRGE